MVERLARNPLSGEIETKLQYETSLRRAGVQIETHHAFGKLNPAHEGRLRKHLRAASAANDRGDTAEVRSHLTAMGRYLDGLSAPDDEDEEQQEPDDTWNGHPRVHAPPRGMNRGGFDGDNAYEQMTAERDLSRALAEVEHQTQFRRAQAVKRLAFLYAE
jgi:hypothetical protein